MIRVELPSHLRTLARVTGEVKLEVTGAVTQRTILDALEARFPALLGTIRDQVTFERRPFVRFFACAQDLSHEPADTPVPDAVARGEEPFLVVGAIAGGSGAGSTPVAAEFQPTVTGTGFSCRAVSSLATGTGMKRAWKKRRNFGS